jgi:hypothetical protein
VSSEPYCVVAADVKGDGLVDLISVNSYDSTCRQRIKIKMDFCLSKIQFRHMILIFNATKKLLSKKGWRWRYGLFMTVAFAALPLARAEDVSLNLLDGKALGLDSGVSFGVPWPQGAVGRGATFSLSAQGKDLPVQSWPLAYWPDGSIKWSGFATVVPAGLAGPVTLSTGFVRRRRCAEPSRTTVRRSLLIPAR